MFQPFRGDLHADLTEWENTDAYARETPGRMQAEAPPR
jgi:hypothetical protein